MTDRHAFIAAIKAAPDDDAPRLIYADWLDEQGESERAEFIRVQVELERKFPNWHGMPADAFSGGEYHALRQRESELLGAPFETKWLPDWPLKRTMVFGDFGGERAASEINRRQPTWQWARGFIESIRCSMDAIAQHLDAIAKEHPLRRVELIGDYRQAADHVGFWKIEYPGIEFVLPPEPMRGQAGWVEINGQRVRITDWQLRTNPEAIEEAAQMPDDEAANPGLRRETAAQRARSMEFAGRHRRRR